MLNKFFVVFALLLIVSSAYAPRTTQIKVENLAGVYSDICAKFSWRTTTDAVHNSADFNNYRIKTTSSVNALDGLDINQTGTTYNSCSLPPGATISIEVERFDGNKDGLFQSLGVLDEVADDAGDANTTVAPGTTTQAGWLLFFNMLSAIAAFAALLVIGIVLSFIFSKVFTLDLQK